MNNLDRRIQRLEEKLGAKDEPRVIVVTINLDNFPEDSYTVAERSQERLLHDCESCAQKKLSLFGGLMRYVSIMSPSAESRF
jgi:hypothetical protein